MVEDDGIGRGNGSTIKGTGLGSRLVGAMAGTMGAEVRYSDNRPGTVAQLIFSLEAHQARDIASAQTREAPALLSPTG